MSSTHSLSDFYKLCLEDGYLGYEYPFGLWLFGSIIIKVTNIDLVNLALTVPLINLCVLCVLYYSYAKKFGLSRNQATLSLAFLLSMPVIATDILGFETDVFVMPFIIAMLHLLPPEKAQWISNWRNLILIVIFMFTLCFSHTGTYIFFLSLMVAYLVLYSAILGKFHRYAFFAFISLVVIYPLIVGIFPHIHLQYIDKGRILLSIGNLMASKLYLIFMKDLTEIIYEGFIVDVNPVYPVFLGSIVYIICKLALLLNSKAGNFLAKIKSYFRNILFSVPVIGSVRYLSHTLPFWPIWLGPIHVALAMIGALRTDKKLLALLLSLIVVTVPTGYLAKERALREIEYLFIIIPILSVIGLYHVKRKIRLHTKGKIKKVIIFVGLVGIFSSIVFLPVIANFYYHPLISGASYEREGLSWLSKIGVPGEGVAGAGYGHRISVYSNKIPPDEAFIAYGTELRNFEVDHHRVFFSLDAEEYAKDLYASFGVSYLISSERVLRNLGKTGGFKYLKLDYNKLLDKIYSSEKHFSIYRYIKVTVKRVNIPTMLNFKDSPIVEDAGNTFVVKTNYYKTKLSKASPDIVYLGNKTTNFLGEGGIAEYLFIEAPDPHYFTLENLAYSSILLGNNQIVYTASLKDKGENLGTLVVKYTFFEKAFKREIIVSNDWIDRTMFVQYTMRFFTPLQYFTFQLDMNKLEKRVMYPCDDYVELKDIKFNKFYISDGNSGIYIHYENTAPYPNYILYTGSKDYDYYLIDHSLEKYLSPSESIHIAQWFSIGNSEIAYENIEDYRWISVYPYPKGKKPLILVSYIDSLNRISNESFNALLVAFDKLRESGVTNYTEAINFDQKEVNESRVERLLMKGVNIIGLEDVGKLNSSEQEGKIKKLKKNARIYEINIKGFMPKKTAIWS